MTSNHLTGPRPLLYMLLLWLPSATDCAMGPTRYHTVVEGRLKPSHFKFTTFVDHTVPGAGGWRTACIHLNISRIQGESYICTFSPEFPMETQQDGVISVASAQRKAAKCANLAARIAFATTTPATPLGMACTAFRQSYNAILQRAQRGARVVNFCREPAVP